MTIQELIGMLNELPANLKDQKAIMGITEINSDESMTARFYHINGIEIDKRRLINTAEEVMVFLV